MGGRELVLWAVLGLATLSSGQQVDEGIESLIADFFNLSSTEGPGGASVEPVIVTPQIPVKPEQQPASLTGPIAGGGHEPQPEGGDEECECVPYYLCSNGSIVDNGVGIIDIRFRECDNYLEVCCKIPNTVKEPITPIPKGHVSCGQRNVDGVGFRITGGVDSETQFGEIPWMVAILREELLDSGDKLHIYQCGGSLIHRQVVMTAAHCVAGRNSNSLRTRAGEWDTQTKNELIPYQDRSLAQVIIHEKYYAGALYNDVALLVLAEPFEYAENVDVVCLPKPNDIILDKNCFASGWGKDKYGKEGNYQVILKKVDLPMVPRDKCVDALRRTRLGPFFKLHDSFVCAGGEEGKDTCKGDGGGPLVCPVPGKPNQYQQVGMVAWGIGCGQEEIPAVYVHVSYFRNWIDQHMKKLNFQPEYNY